MKNEAAFGYEALLCNVKKREMCASLHGDKVAASYERSECFISTKSMLH